jgi:hypothetical protein
MQQTSTIHAISLATQWLIAGRAIWRGTYNPCNKRACTEFHPNRFSNLSEPPPGRYQLTLFSGQGDSGPASLAIVTSHRQDQPWQSKGRLATLPWT